MVRMVMGYGCGDVVGLVGLLWQYLFAQVNRPLNRRVFDDCLAFAHFSSKKQHGHQRRTTSESKIAQTYLNHKIKQISCCS